MQSNLPPGCSESDIPGNRPEDQAVDKAIEAKQCEACTYYFKPLTDGFPCDDCHIDGSGFIDRFEAEEDEAEIADRLQAAAEAKEDGHNDN